MTRAQRVACYLAPVFVCLAVYRRAPFTWFRMDDFAWLSIPQYFHSWRDVAEALFAPKAEGTVRIFSERLYFGVLAGLFGLNGGIFHAVALGVWFVDLALLQSIGARLTGSRAAGLLAALLWTVSAVIATPLDWASCFNQVLCALCVLGAFYARLRWLESGESKWRWIEAIAYLAGFGVLEVIVMYPAMVLLHAAVDERARARWRTALWMLIPAAAFTAAHFLLISAATSPYYQIVVDRRMFSTFVRYLGWSIGPSQIFLIGDQWITAGKIATRAIALALAAFLILRFARGDRMVIFFAGWFVLWIAPVLPLPNHVIDYYATIPGMGLAWLAGAALVAAWRSGWALRGLAMVLAGAYVVGSVAEARVITIFHLRTGSRMRMLVRATEAEVAAHPGSAFVFQGVDYDLFRGGFRDNPLPLVGVERVWLAPGDDAVLNHPEFGDVSRFRTTPDALLPLLDAGQARVINLSEDNPRDATGAYRQVLRAQALASHRNTVRTGDPSDSPRMGEGWFAIENGARWMGKRAVVTLAGPRTDSEKLYVNGYASAAALVGGPLRLTIRAAGREVASVTLVEKDKPFAIQAELPNEFTAVYAIEVTVECSRTFRPDTDRRDLGVVISGFEVR
jgi:hypothetical protein